MPKHCDMEAPNRQYDFVKLQDEYAEFHIQHTLAFHWGYILKNPVNGKTQCMRLSPYGKNGVRGTKDTQNMTLNMYN
jgi:hypothetical protein